MKKLFCITDRTKRASIAPGGSPIGDDENKRLFEFISNNFEFSAKKIALIYKQRWKIELLFKQIKQNFPLKYFLGDNENAIEIQIWAAMLANLLITLVKSKVKRSWAVSNMVSLIRNQLMNHVDIYIVSLKIQKDVGAKSLIGMKIDTKIHSLQSTGGLLFEISKKIASERIRINK